MTFRSFAVIVIRLFFTPTVVGIALFAFNVPHYAHADAAGDIQVQIDSHNKQITDLDSQIAGFQKQLVVVNGQKQTLQTSIAALDLSRQKITAQITQTQNQIAATNLKLNQLAIIISDKSASISLDKKSVSSSMRILQQESDATLIEQVLSNDTIATAWEAVDQTRTMNDAFRANASTLTSAKILLTDQQTQVAANKAQLSMFNSTLITQQAELDANTKAKQALLKQTKATESTYQSLIATKKAQQKAFQSELSSLEDSLKVIINPATIAHVGSGVLAWPMSKTFLAGCAGKSTYLGNNYCITQFFGTTPFSTANPQVYNGSGHNAIDIGMPSGTAVLAALGGTVMGTGNTDLVPGCYSYGKWVLLKHGNGLDTLYAHLSSVGVSKGDSVTTGSTLGYSGMTGYATGPHLHFGVYVSQATQILTLQQYRGATSPCANATMPVSPKEGYLNPMSYL
jgi:murein DD-endopeptidase MepM/ murein hydrolase activator NlpD